MTNIPQVKAGYIKKKKVKLKYVKENYCIDKLLEYFNKYCSFVTIQILLSAPINTKCRVRYGYPSGLSFLIYLVSIVENGGLVI